MDFPHKNHLKSGQIQSQAPHNTIPKTSPALGDLYGRHMDRLAASHRRSETSTRDAQGLGETAARGEFFGPSSGYAL